MRKVYICSPCAGYSGKTCYENLKKARDYCVFAVEQEFLPLAPQIYFLQFLDGHIPWERDYALEWVLAALRICDELWVFGDRRDVSMRREIRLAAELALPVRYFDEQCNERRGAK
jgi:hypothetical protein